tara:strand:+ start:1309 stop:3405 length:2097 start_codon:yes stop_codon:yes gene_type:complete
MSVILNIVSAFDEKGIRKAQKAFAQLETTTQKASYAMKQWGGPATTAAIGAVTAELVRAVKAAGEDQKSQEQLKIALENTVGANQQQVAAVEDSVTALMYQTATADDELRPALSKLVRATQDVTQAQSLLKLALDISAGSGRDLSSVTSALSRAALGSFTALTKLGIPLDQNAIKAKDLDGVLSGLASSFSGAASKNAQTFEGQLKTLKIAVGEVEENIGKQLIPILSDYAAVLVSLTTDTAKAESSTKTWFDRLKSGIGYLISNTPALGPALKALGFVNDKIREQAEALKQNSQVTSRVTKNFRDLTLVTETNTKTTKASTTAADKAKAAAAAYADWLAKAEAATAKLRQETQTLADALREKLNLQLDDAVTKLADAQGAFDAFGKGVGAAITGSFNFGDAQSEATGNAADLQKALDDQAVAQKKVNDAQADFNFFQRDDYAKVLADAMADLAVATGKVSAAQAKPMTFFDSLTKQAQKAKDFGVLVNRLIAAGLSETALSQVLAAGVDGGTAIATEILGSADGVLKANTLTQSMTDLADEMGKRAAAKYYGAGVTSATEFLKGIQDTIAKVEVTLKKPNLDQVDVITAAVGAMSPEAILDLQAEIGRYLQGGNFGMGVPMMAEGGIVTSPTLAMVGEGRGPEAIIPLDKMSSMGFGGNNGGITVNVQGGDPNAVVQALRNYMRQNGSIPIKTANLY